MGKPTLLVADDGVPENEGGMNEDACERRNQRSLKLQTNDYTVI